MCQCICEWLSNLYLLVVGVWKLAFTISGATYQYSGCRGLFAHPSMFASSEVRLRHCAQRIDTLEGKSNHSCRFYWRFQLWGTALVVHTTYIREFSCKQGMPYHVAFKGWIRQRWGQDGTHRLRMALQSYSNCTPVSRNVSWVCFAGRTRSKWRPPIMFRSSSFFVAHNPGAALSK